MPGIPGCRFCGGTGGYIDDNDNSVECRCEFWVKFRKRVPPEIAEASAAFESPLLTPGPTGEAIVDLTGENLFIKGWWDDLVSHLYTVLSYKMMRNLLYPYFIVTDLNIVDTKLRNSGNKPKKDRDQEDPARCLTDYLGEHKELVIIRLGFLGYKNQAAAGYLKEALGVRQVAAKPTWIVEEPESPFGPGHFSYDQTIAEYIAKRFKVIDLVSDKKREIVPRGFEGAPLVEETGMSLDSEPTAPRKVVMPKAVFKAEEKSVVSTINFDMLGENGVSKKKFRSKSYNKKRSGGDDE